jgi:predicted AAA+ superfamily ATPase
MEPSRLIEALSHWNPWGREPFRAGIPRDARAACLPWLERSEVVAVCGMRRSGKSTLLRQLAAARMEAGVPARDILFVNFEDPVFLESPLDVRAMDRVFDAWFEQIGPQGMPCLFLDEVQNVEGWARWVRARVETGRARVAVSGSSSRLLEPEIGSVLTGRHWTCDLWPLSFREYLRFRGIEVADRAALLTAGPEVRQALARYLRLGGLPEPALTDDEHLAAALLRQYFRDLIYRDVVSRHEVRDVRALERVAHWYLVNTANLATYNRVKDVHALAMDQVRSYTAHLEEAWLIRQVPRFSWKVGEQGRAPRKVYAVDHGLRNAVAFHFSGDAGRVAETVVHTTLARSPDVSVFYFQGKQGCDFLTWRGAAPAAAVQVCYEHDGPLPEREVEGLVEAMEAAGLQEGTVVTRALAEEREVGGRRVRLVPLWRWLWEVEGG